MTHEEVLARLDDAATAFEFPVLDNAFWRFAAARLRGFRRGDSWALVFEILVYHTQANHFAVEVYSYGPLSGREDGFIGGISAIEESPGFELWDSEGEWIRTNTARVVDVYGHTIRVAAFHEPIPIPDESRTVYLSQGDDMNEAAFLRALVREMGLGQMLPADVLYTVVPELEGAAELLRISRWDHPDVSAGELPSNSKAIVAATAALLTEQEFSAREFAPHIEGANTFWEQWERSNH